MSSLELIPKLPVIHLSKKNLKPGTDIWLSVCRNVREALEQYGCFEAVYDEVPLELHNAIFGNSKELFDLPTETKMKNTSQIPYNGYVGPSYPRAPHYEGLGFDHATSLEAAQSFTDVIWPQGNENFCKNIMLYSKPVAELEQIVNRMVFESYGVRKYYESYNQDSTTYILRFMRYWEGESKESNLGCVSHVDKTFVSILHQNEVNGLQVKTKNGNWIHVEFSPSSFVVIAGYGLMAWSNGRIHAPSHRVLVNGSKNRYSIGLFSYKNGIINIPEELVDNEHPLRFKSFDHFGLLGFSLTEDGQKAECVATAYCGV